MAEGHRSPSWSAALAGIVLVQAGVFLGSPAGTEALRGLFDRPEPVEPRTEMTMAEAYGEHYTAFAVACPEDSRQTIERNLGGEARQIPVEGVPPSRNYLLLRTAEGETEWHRLRREVVDFCGGLDGIGLRPVDDSLLLRFDEEAGRWYLDR